MKHAPLTHETFSCPECGEESFRYASLCHACGRQFSEQDKLDDSSRSAHRRTQARQSGHWEPLLGVSLLLLVIGFALSLWVGSTMQGNVYYDGQAAESRRDWDAAVALYKEAGDYPGAPARLASASRTRDERDRLYNEGIESLARKKWGAALTALGKVREIQPGFRDIDSLLPQAEEGAERAAATGIVYLVTDGPEPGLYYLDHTGTPIQLPGSDEHSLVRAIYPGNHAVIYDRPDEGGRSVVLAWPGIAAPGGTITNIPIRPRILDPDGMGIFSRDGIWWFPPPGEPAPQGSDRLYFRSYKTDPVVCPTTCGGSIALHDGSTRVAALDPSSSRILLATTSGSSGTPNFHTSLYIAGPWGNDPFLLHEPAGDVDGASFSPDGRWLLYLTEQNNETTSRRLWVTRVPESAGTGVYGRPRQLGFLQWYYEGAGADLTGIFLHSHDGETLLAATRRTGYGERLSVYSLADSNSSNLDGFGWPSGSLQPIASRIDLVGSDSVLDRESSAFAHKGLMLASHRQEGLRSQISLYSREGDRTMRYTFPFPPGTSRPMRLYFSPHDDYLVESFSSSDGGEEGFPEKVYVTPVSRGSTTPACGSCPPQLLTSTRLTHSPDRPTLALPASGTHLVYVSAAKELKAVRYTGEKETLLAENVAAVWDLHAEPGDIWRR